MTWNSCNRNYPFRSHRNCQRIRTIDISTTGCQVLFMNEWTGIQLKLGRDGFLTADFSLNKRWRVEVFLTSKEKRYLFCMYFLTFCPFSSPTTNHHFQFALYTWYGWSCCEWVLKSIPAPSPCLSEHRCFVLYFAVTQQAADRFKWRMSYRCVTETERGLSMSTCTNHNNNNPPLWTDWLAEPAFLLSLHFCSICLHALLWTELYKL